MNWAKMSQRLLSVWNHQHMHRHTTKKPIMLEILGGQNQIFLLDSISDQENVDSIRKLIKRSAENDLEETKNTNEERINPDDKVLLKTLVKGIICEGATEPQIPSSISSLCFG